MSCPTPPTPPLPAAQPWAHQPHKLMHAYDMHLVISMVTLVGEGRGSEIEGWNGVVIENRSGCIYFLFSEFIHGISHSALLMWNAMYSIYTRHLGTHTFPFWLYRLRCSLTLLPAMCKCFIVIFCWKHYKFLWRGIFLDKVILLCSIFVFWHRRIVVSSKNTSHTEKMNH